MSVPLEEDVCVVSRTGWNNSVTFALMSRTYRYHHCRYFCYFISFLLFIAYEGRVRAFNNSRLKPCPRFAARSLTQRHLNWKVNVLIELAAGAHAACENFMWEGEGDTEEEAAEGAQERVRSTKAAKSPIGFSSPSSSLPLNNSPYS